MDPHGTYEGREFHRYTELTLSTDGRFSYTMEIAMCEEPYGKSIINGNGLWTFSDDVIKFVELEGSIFQNRNVLVLAKYGNKEILAKKTDIENYIKDPSYLWAEFVKK
jgi:hypothetical protein